MLRRKIALKLIMDDLKLGLTRFDDRLSLQKSVYLLGELGLHLGYRFTWYLRGPYSPELTRDAFEVSEEKSPIAQQALNYRLGPNAKDVIETFKILANDNRPAHLDKAKWLEVLASVHYLARYSSVGNNFDAVFRELSMRKPDLCREKMTLQQAWQALKKLGMVSDG